MAQPSGEEGLIFEVIKQAIVDATGGASRQHEASAKRFIDSHAFVECCDHIGGNASVIRKRLADDADGIRDRVHRRDLHKDPQEESAD